MSHTNHSDPKNNPWYPRHASDRADELIEELDATLCEMLYDELHKKSIGE